MCVPQVQGPALGPPPPPLRSVAVESARNAGGGQL